VTHKFPRQPFSQLRGQRLALVGPAAAEIRLRPLANQFSPLNAPPNPTLDPKKPTGKLPKLTHENRLLGREVTPTGVLSKGVRGGGKLGLPNWPRVTPSSPAFTLLHWCTRSNASAGKFGPLELVRSRSAHLIRRPFDTEEPPMSKPGRKVKKANHGKRPSCSRPRKQRRQKVKT